MSERQHISGPGSSEDTQVNDNLSPNISEKHNHYFMRKIILKCRIIIKIIKNDNSSWQNIRQYTD